ncbi:MAG: hypothetical protein IH587_15120, partial [Anaerolineae bacterium]|nr:hypothetical protein [Anaerolineae bacterium]
MTHTQSRSPITPFMLVIGAAIVLFFVSIVAPFYALGLHLEPANLVAGGSFDPKDFALTGGWLRWLGFFTLMIAPLAVAISGGLIAIRLIKRGQQLPSRLRLYGVLGCAAALGLWLFILSPLGRLILAWFLD